MIHISWANPQPPSAPLPPSRPAADPLRVLDIQGVVRAIAWEEAQAAGITLAQIVGDRRSQEMVRPRHIAMWRAARETCASLVAIGRVFGGRDHTSVLYAIRKVEAARAKAEATQQ